MKVFLLFFFSVFLLLANENIPSFVSTKWLGQHYNDKNLLLIDVRKAEIFKKGHLQKSIDLPTFTYLFDTKNSYKMPKLSFLTQVFSKAGVDDNTMVVAYGDKELIWGARLYWLLRVLGHKRVGLLNVSYEEAKKLGLHVTTNIYHPKEKKFIPRVDNSILDTKLSTILAIHKDTIIDGRPFAYYIGKKSHAKRFGHIPTALNYAGSNNYVINGDRSHMKNFTQLKKIYAKLPKNKKVILYCEDGADAALNFMVLEKLGYKASVYDGSWLEWGDNNHLPVETKVNRLK